LPELKKNGRNREGNNNCAKPSQRRPPKKQAAATKSNAMASAKSKIRESRRSAIHIPS
jgi:hypothetical protein